SPAARGPNGPSAARCSTTNATASTPAFAAACRCSPQPASSTPAPAGPASSSRSPARMSPRPATAATAWSAPRSSVPAATPTSARSPTTAPPRPGCGTASTRSRSPSPTRATLSAWPTRPPRSSRTGRAMPIIEAEGLTKTYRVFQKQPGLWGAVRGLLHRTHKEVQAVADVSFAIEPGEMVAFLGPNGAGKTTTLKMLSGLIYPTSGTARVLGFVPWERPDAFRRQFSLVMGQKNQLWWDLPAADSFNLHREIYSLSHDTFHRTLNQLTAVLGVEKLTRRRVRELWLGERMKMELIAALLHEPRLLLLDEPTIGLDVVAQVAIQRCLKEYNASRGVTMLLTSHY